MITVSFCHSPSSFFRLRNLSVSHILTWITLHSVQIGKRETTGYIPVPRAQSCPTLCNPVDCSLPSSSVHGLFQARILEMTILGCHFLLQGIFPMQGSSPHLLCLLRWQAGSLPLALPNHFQNNKYLMTKKKKLLKILRINIRIKNMGSFSVLSSGRRMCPFLPILKSPKRQSFFLTGWTHFPGFLHPILSFSGGSL